MNEKGRSQRLVIAIALSLTGGIASGKSANPNAIIGGDLYSSRTPSAITHGGADAIIGGDANAIIGGDALAIIGGDRRKAARPSAIIGGDANAIIGGDALAIIGGDRRKAARPSAIIGGDANAIIGGDVRNYLVVGPVDAVDAESGIFTVLGRTFKSTAAPQGLSRWRSELAVGMQPMVAVTSHTRQDGTLAPSAVVRLGETYVAGATRVLLRGSVSRVDYSVGRLTIGKQEVDVSSVLLNSAPIAVGDSVAVVGTQPTARGIVIAEAIK